ncbi:MAG TPA: hypothetical protein DCQ84_12290 [Candidatus Competibacteraceae bacterium]|nr:GNAT family N-acetyltransferase [Candidatus Competibacteraceae bacterium]HAO33715.1 hypothetical protein [Candidatus Competibacteraceae bacterium]
MNAPPIGAPAPVCQARDEQTHDRADASRHPFTARRLTSADVERVYRLHRHLLEQASTPGLFKPESRRFFEQHIAAVGHTVGVFAGSTLIAYGIVGLPDDGRYNFGVALGLPSREWPRVAHLDGCGVLPQWRGKGLQRWLARWRIATAVSVGRRHLLSTAAPANHASCRNLLGVGLTVHGLQPMFGGRWRHLFYRDLRDPSPLDLASAEPVALADLGRQQALLAQGYRGYALRGQGESAHLLYARPLFGCAPP